MIEFLQNDYGTYFTDVMEPHDGQAPVKLLEFIHYTMIIHDEQLCDPIAYRACKASHIYSLLRRLTVGLERHESIGL